MEQLKAVGKAIKNSPRTIRKKFGHADHQHLQEDWYHSEDPVNAGVTFYVKYLGSTEVTRTHGPGSTDDAVKTIVQHAKIRGGKLQKVMMTISSRYVRLVDIQLQMKLDELPLYRVSYCTVDPYYDKVFCYISRNAETKGLECHAFLCSKKSKAEAITLTVAQAFNIAFERWQAAKKQRALQEQARKKEGAAANGVRKESPPDVDTSIGEAITSPLKHTATTAPPKQASPPKQTASNEPVPLLPPPPTKRPSPSPPPPSVDVQQVQDPLLDLDVTPANPPVSKMPLRRRESKDDSQIRRGLLEVKSTLPKAVSLDYLQLDDQFDAEFTKLAQARSNPRLPIGDHINQTTMEDDVLGFLHGEKSGQDLALSHSVDDLLDL